MDADRVAEFALRELDRKIPREAPKPKSRDLVIGRPPLTPSSPASCGTWASPLTDGAQPPEVNAHQRGGDPRL
jgi:hypothetical protein